MYEDIHQSVICSDGNNLDVQLHEIVINSEKAAGCFEWFSLEVRISGMFINMNILWGCVSLVIQKKKDKKTIKNDYDPEKL